MVRNEVPITYTVELSYRQLIAALVAIEGDLEEARKRVFEQFTQEWVDFWTQEIEYLEGAYNTLKNSRAKA